MPFVKASVARHDYDPPINRGDVVWMHPDEGTLILIVQKPRQFTINALLERLFMHNIVLNETHHDRCLRDEHILKIVKLMHPEGAVQSVRDVQNRRRNFNEGTGHWKKIGTALSRGLKTSVEHTDSTLYFDEESGAQSPRVNINVTEDAVTRGEVQKIVSDAVDEKSTIFKARVDHAIDGIDAKIDDAISRRPRIIIKMNDQDEIELDDVVHAKFHECMVKIKAGLNIALIGPTGSGKTYLAGQIAKALGRSFTFNSMSEGISESYLLGRSLPNDDGSWSYRPSPFVRSFVGGGVHLLDEMDSADPNLLVQVNAALANGKLSVPFADDVEPFVQHKDSVIIAAMNTYGTGANREYVGRNALDAATLNRYTFGSVFIDYDNSLERNLANTIVEDASNAKHILERCWAIREKIKSAGLRRVMSTRNIEDACRLFVASDGDESMMWDTFFASWSEDEKARVA